MIELDARNDGGADAPTFFARIDELDLGRNVRGAHRKMNLFEQDRIVPQPLLRGGRQRIENEVCVFTPDGAEERNADDVVPVGMRDEGVDRSFDAFAKKRSAELADPRAGVEDDHGAVGKAKIDADRVASVPYGRQAG